MALITDFPTESTGLLADPLDEPALLTHEELSHIAKLLLPLVATFLLQYLLPITLVLAVGHLGPDALAAALLALMTFNITGLSIFQGISTSLDTLCAQAYGANQPLLVGVYFQRCVAVMLTIYIPLAVVWWFLAPLLELVVPGHDLCLQAQLFLRILMVGAPGFILFEAGKRFLQAQKLFNAATYVLVAVVPVNACLLFGLVYHTDLGYLGAPLATVILYWLMALLLGAYVVFVDGKQCWNGLQLQLLFRQWGPLMALALPGVVMVEAEFLAFEVLTVFALHFGTVPLATQLVVLSVLSFFFQVPFAVLVAFTTRIAHLLGAGSTKGARHVAKLGFVCALALGLVNCTVVVTNRTRLSNLFTGDADVVAMAQAPLAVLALNQLWDCFNVVFAGVLRAQGRQRIGLVWNVVCYYAIALPLAYVAAFRFNHGVVGLWCGLLIGVASLAFAEGWCVVVSDWDAIQQASRDRTAAAHH